MMRLACLLLLACVLSARADDAPPPSPVVDPAVVAAHYREVASRPQFRESVETVADLHWGDMLSQWLRHLVSRFQDFQVNGQLTGVARTLVVVLALVTLVALFLLFRRLTRRHRERSAPAEESLEPGKALLSPEQYEARLQRAVAAGEWRTAWLVSWLQLLARLERRNLVAADRSRTNREYLAQLRARQLPAEVFPLLAAMVDDYDRTIYGRRTIDEAIWRSFRARLEESLLLLGLPASPTEEPA